MYLAVAAYSSLLSPHMPQPYVVEIRTDHRSKFSMPSDAWIYWRVTSCIKVICIRTSNRPNVRHALHVHLRRHPPLLRRHLLATIRIHRAMILQILSLALDTRNALALVLVPIWILRRYLLFNSQLHRSTLGVALSCMKVYFIFTIHLCMFNVCTM